MCGIKFEKSQLRQSAFKVSAIVSTYNSEKFMRGCLQDLTEQTLYKKGKLEIIVIDSASEQNEQAIVREFQARYPNIFYIRALERETLYAAWNRGIQAARGQYITNANTDDRHRKDALGILSRALDEDPDVDLVYGNCHVSTTANESYEDNDKRRIFRYPEYFAPVALVHFQFGPQPMWRKSVHDNIGYFDGSFQAAGDYDFNIRFALKGLRALHVPNAVGLYLLHNEAISSANNDVMQRENARIAQTYKTVENVEKLYKAAGIPCDAPEDRAKALIDMGIRLQEFYPPWYEGRVDNNIPFALECFLKAAELCPLMPASVNNLAALLFVQGFLDEATKLMREFLVYVQNEVVRRNLELLTRQDTPGKQLQFLPSGLLLPTQRSLAFENKGFDRQNISCRIATMDSGSVHPTVTDMQTPNNNTPVNLSVVIATRNRCKNLLQCLEALAQQTYPAMQFEVLICGGGSIDGTGDRVQCVQVPYRLEYLSQDSWGFAAARNMGIRHAHGGLILFLDENVLPAPDLLERHVQAHERLRGTKTAVLGIVSAPPATTLSAELLQNSGILPPYQAMSAEQFYDYTHFRTVNLSLPRSAFDEAGFFDEDFTGSVPEDMELGYRLYRKGYRVFFDASCKGVHDNSLRLFHFCTRRVFAGRNAVLTAFKHPELTQEVVGLPTLDGIAHRLRQWLITTEGNRVEVNGLLEQIMSSLRLIENAPPQNATITESQRQQIMTSVDFINTYCFYQGLLDGQSLLTRDASLPARLLRITFVTPGSSLSGGIKMIFEYCNRLAERGHHVTIVAPYGDKPDWFVLDPRVTFIQSDYNDEHLLRDVPVGDVVFATYWMTAFYVARLPASKGVKFYLIQGRESIGLSHSPEKANLTYILPLHQVTVSSWLADWLEQEFVQKASVVPNALDASVFFAEPHIRTNYPAGDFRIGMVFNTQYGKGLVEGLEAFYLVKKRYPQAKLIMLGTEQPSQEVCDEFYYNIIGDAIRHYYNSLDVFVSTSWSEGFGLLGLEAITCGIPLVTVDSGGCREYVVHEETALVCPPQNPHELAKAVIRLLHDPSLGKRLRQNGLKIAQKFSWDVSVQTMEDTLFRVLRERSQEANIYLQKYDAVGV